MASAAQGLVSVLGHTDENLAGLAYSALLRIGDAAVPVLEEALVDDSPAIRSRSLELLTALETPVENQALPGEVPALSDVLNKISAQQPTFQA